MATPYIGDIRMFAGNFAPLGWALCQGQILSISQNDALYSLIGTTYGGDGQTTFALPDLRGRIPVHMASAYPLGGQAGTETVTLTTTNMPSHRHLLVATTGTGTVTTASGNILATSVTTKPYIAVESSETLNPSVITPVGGSQPHENMMPYLALNFIIALEGVYPMQN